MCIYRFLIIAMHTLECIDTYKLTVANKRK